MCQSNYAWFNEKKKNYQFCGKERFSWKSLGLIFGPKFEVGKFLWLWTKFNNEQINKGSRSKTSMNVVPNDKKNPWKMLDKTLAPTVDFC